MSTSPSSAELQKATKKKRSTVKGKFHRLYNAFNSEVQCDSEIDVLGQILKDLEDCYNDLENKNSDYIETLDSGDEDEKIAITSVNDDIFKMYKELCHARSIVVSQRRKIDEEERANKIHVDVKEKVNISGGALRVKKLDAPVFNGSMRSYPTFKKDYELHMMPSFGKDPFALRSCLQGPALDAVKGISDNFEEMMRRLDMKYGCASKLVDAVLQDIQKLRRVPDDDSMKFLRMIEVIEYSWLDLKAMNLESEMNTSIMMSQVEKLLPLIQRREWALVRNKLLEEKKMCTFENLLDFLKREREAIEYLNDDMRVEPKKVNLVESASERVSETQSEIHPEICVMKEMIEGLVQVVRGMSNNNSNYTNRNNNNNNNNSKKCWYHSTDSHGINNCYDFNALDPKARIDLVKKKFVCFGCLQAGHLARNCANMVPCPVIESSGEGCGRRHHEKLHIRRVDGSFNSGVHMSEMSRGSALLMLSEVSSERGTLTVLWDPGANVSLLTHSAAQRLGLMGKEVTLRLTKVGNQIETVETKEYVLPLIDNSGKVWRIHVYGMNDITSNQPEVEVTEIGKIFNIKETLLRSRPKGQVDALIGTDWCKLLPDKVDERGSLQLMKNQFGYCV